MTIKEVNQLRKEGLDNATKEQLMEAYPIVNATKNTFASLEKEIKEALEGKMEVGDQLSFDFGSDIYTSKMVSVDEISFDCSDEDLYIECSKAASAYCKLSVDKTAIKKDYVKGILHPDIIKHVVVTQQQEMKMTKKAKKEVA